MSATILNAGHRFISATEQAHIRRQDANPCARLTQTLKTCLADPILYPLDMYNQVRAKFQEYASDAAMQGLDTYSPEQWKEKAGQFYYQKADDLSYQSIKAFEQKALKFVNQLTTQDKLSPKNAQTMQQIIHLLAHQETAGLLVSGSGIAASTLGSCLSALGKGLGVASLMMDERASSQSDLVNHAIGSFANDCLNTPLAAEAGSSIWGHFSQGIRGMTYKAVGAAAQVARVAPLALKGTSKVLTTTIGAVGVVTKGAALGIEAAGTTLESGGQVLHDYSARVVLRDKVIIPILQNTSRLATKKAISVCAGIGFDYATSSIVMSAGTKISATLIGAHTAATPFAQSVENAATIAHAVRWSLIALPPAYLGYEVLMHYLEQKERATKLMALLSKFNVDLTEQVGKRLQTDPSINKEVANHLIILLLETTLNTLGHIDVQTALALEDVLDDPAMLEYLEQTLRKLARIIKYFHKVPAHLLNT
jgi:hypothetical protein